LLLLQSDLLLCYLPVLLLLCLPLFFSLSVCFKSSLLPLLLLLLL
jgi:hypothetical protein